VSARVLVADDDPSLVRALRIGLSARGYQVHVARTGEEAISQVALVAPDVVLLDLGLPDLDGTQVCRSVREWSSVPIVVLSASGDEQRKVAALDGGADDYVTKPFGMAELEARIRVALRHGRSGSGPEPTELAVGSLVLDLVGHTGRLEGRELELTAREFELLAYLARRAGKVCTQHMILRDVWGPEYGAESHYLRVYAHRIRRKLGEPAEAMLRTHPGIGYQLVGDDVALPVPPTPPVGGCRESPSSAPDPGPRVTPRVFGP
jgi:two-component system KDP operon response regulator KdpE